LVLLCWQHNFFHELGFIRTVVFRGNFRKLLDLLVLHLI
jgi:hypothetical protein